MSATGPDHDRWAEDVGAFLLGALPDEDREGFEAHLTACETCRADVDDLAVASTALPLGVEQHRAPPEIGARIMDVVRAEAELLAAAAGPRADLPPEPARRRWRFGSLSLRPGLALAAVLALLVVGGVTGAVLGGGGDGGDPGRTVQAAVERGYAETATARLVVHDRDSKLTVRSLPAPPEGRVYQVWLMREGSDTPEPTDALFTPRGNGSGSVTVPGSLRGVAQVLVTHEPDGGSPAPTRSPVITADLTA